MDSKMNWNYPFHKSKRHLDDGSETKRWDGWCEPLVFEVVDRNKTSAWSEQEVGLMTRTGCEMSFWPTMKSPFSSSTPMSIVSSVQIQGRMSLKSFNLRYYNIIKTQNSKFKYVRCWRNMKHSTKHKDGSIQGIKKQPCSCSNKVLR
jgi:hypothetical protein